MKSSRKLLALAAAPLILALVACGGGDKKTDTPSSTSSGGNQPAATTPSSSSGSSSSGSSNANSGGGSVSGDAIADVITNFAKAKSWKAEIKDESDPDASGKFEYVAPNKYHLASSEFEIIIIGSDSYLKMGGDWVKSPSGVDSGNLFNPDDLKDSIDAAKSAKVTKGGKDKVNGKDCQLYTYTDADTGGDTEMCVADNLPLRITDKSGDSESTITFSDFNSNFDIKAPI